MMLAAGAPGFLFAQPPAAGTVLVTTGGAILDSGTARRTVQALLDRAVDHLPRRYDGDKHWQRQKKVWAGVRVRREGLRLTTKRRWREVRHGLQTKYHVQFPGDPADRPPVTAQILNVQHQAGDAERQAAWLIDIEVSSPLDFAARVERWNWGVQWYSVEISGHMTVRMRATARLSAYPDFSEIPPAIAIDPTIVSASLHLDAFHVDRISKVGGEVAEQWGEVAKKIADEIFLDDISESLPEKLNRAIGKHRDDLRFSAADWVARWTVPADGNATDNSID